MRILLVDDEPEVRRVLEEYLRGAGHEVEAVASGRVALERVEQAERPFDAAIVDWQMPGICGRDVLEQVYERSPLTRLFLVTGLPEEWVNAGSLSVPIAGIWRKPFSLRWMLRELMAGADLGVGAG